MMVPAFNEAVINTKVGKVTLAESPFGYHIIKVTGKKENVKKVKVAFVTQEVIASSETYQQIFAKASKLAAESENVEDFIAAVEDGRMNRRKAQKIHSMANVISGLSNPRQIVLWAFNEDREVGDVSEVFDLEGQFVVAVLITKAEEGYPPIENVKDRLNTFVYNKLKGKIILEQMAELNNDLDAIAQSDGYKLDEMPALTFASRNLKGFGTENEIIGSIFGSSDGGEFGPVEGYGGVFFVKVEKIVNSADQDNYFEISSKLERNLLNRVNQGTVYTALENATEIEDNRLLFY